ncbi:MAG: histidine--tRNA ligase [Rhodospirillaceae bacterium]|nr:histidine--tRNA ligase [Rhodospirillaceae bacterium]
MSKLQPIRGTHDLLPEAMRQHRHVVDTASEVAGRYGYDPMATPVFEATEVFARTLGETSDVVTKEMYSFETKGGDSITLRPENTAGVARAVISNGLQQSLPLRYFYAGPMFRHERPQKGRQRQFHQIGIELIGVAHPLGDVETIAAGAAVLDALGVRDRTVLELNTLGDTESRAAYRAKLVDYLDRFRDDLSEDSLRRLDINPLRILDSKNPRDRGIVADAPVFSDSLTDAARAWFDAVKAGLDAIGIVYTLNERLVRGLDYYCHSAFEFTTEALGAQGAVIAGGRYDGLIGRMGGPDAPGVGWAGGIERLALLADADLPAPRPVALVPIGAAAEAATLPLAERLRAAGYRIDLAFGGNIKKRMKRANQVRARAAVLVGDDELAAGAATVRDLDSGEQDTAPFESLAEALAPFR